MSTLFFFVKSEDILIDKIEIQSSLQHYSEFFDQHQQSFCLSLCLSVVGRTRIYHSRLHLTIVFVVV